MKGYLSLFCGLVGSCVSVEGFVPVRPATWRFSAPYCSTKSTRPSWKAAVVAVPMSTTDEVEIEPVNGISELDIARDPMIRFRTAGFVLLLAALVGTLSGWSVALFKLAIEAVRDFTYGESSSAAYLALIPALGGVFVGMLAVPGKFPPGLRGTAKEVDDFSLLSPVEQIESEKRPLRYLRKAVASVFTLGTGNSLGPEGPAVEISSAMSRIIMNIFPFMTFGVSKDMSHQDAVLKRNRLLLSCGAAAGVSAGFNAPLSGVFFALEVVQRIFEENSVGKAVNGGSSLSSEAQSPATSPSNISAILISSVLSALVSRAILGDHLVLVLSQYSLRTPLMELPLYLGLGAMCGAMAFVFSQTAKVAESLFAGKSGPKPIRNFVRTIPRTVKPIIGGLLCGLIGLVFPQTLFFGYETLNSLLAKSSLPTGVLLSLLGAKTISTALAAGSGLVGGTFAPSLFLGAMLGGAFHNAMDYLFQFSSQGGPGGAFAMMQLADVPAYAMVGAASMLASLFRAPLTATLLLFELTRDYDVILPLMASAGVGSLVADIIEGKVEQERVLQLRRDRDTVSYGNLSDNDEQEDELED